MAAAGFGRTSGRHRGWQRILRPVATGLTIFSMVTTLAGVAVWRYAGSASGRARLAAVAQGRLAPLLPGLRLGGLGRDASGALIATNVDIWDADGRRAIHADRVRVRPRWTTLLRRRVWLDEVRLDGVRVLGRPLGGDAGGGSLNLTGLLRPRSKAGDPAPARPSAARDHLPVAVRVDRIVIADGAVDLWAGGEAPRIVVRDLNLRARFDSAGRRTTAAVDRVSLGGSIDQRAFTVAATGHGQLRTERTDRTNDGGAIEAILDELRVTGATPEGEIVLHAGATGKVRALKVWLTGTGPLGASVSAVGDLGLGSHLGQLGLGPYHLRFAADVPALAALSPTVPVGAVAVRGQVRGEGTPLAPGSRAQASLYVPAATLADHRVTEGYLQASSDGTAWRLEKAEVRAPGTVARAQGNGEGPRVEGRMEIDVHHLASARRNAGLRDAAAPAVPTRGTGHLRATLAGRIDRELTFNASGRARGLKATAWGRLAALDLSLRGTARRDAGADARWLITARTAGRVVGLDGPSFALAAARFQGAATVESRGARAFQVGSVNVAARGMRAGGIAFDQVELQARADRTTLALSGRAVGRAGTAAIAAHGHRGADPLQMDISLDRLQLAVAAPGPRQQVVLLHPASLVVRPGREIRVDNLEVRASGELLSGQVAVTAKARLGRPPGDQPWARADLTLTRLTTAGIPPVTGTVSAVADGRRARAQAALRMGPSSFDASLDLPAPIRSSLGELRLGRHGRIDVSLDGTDLDLASLPPLQRVLARHGLVGGHVTARVKVSGDIAEPDASLSVAVRALELRDVTGQGRDAVVHTIPGIGASVQLDTAPGKIQASGKVLMYGAGVATFSGTLNAGLGALLTGGAVDIRHTPITARVDIPRFQINALKSLSDELRDTRGWLSGGATVSGTVADPRGQAQLTIADAQVDRLTVGRVTANARSDGRVLRAEARIDGGAATGTLKAAGQVSLGASRALVAELQTRGLNPGVARPFLTGVRELDGVVDTDVRASGTLDALRVNGRLFAYRGRLGVVGQPTFHDVGLAVSVRPGRLELEKLQMYSGGGSLEAKGWVTLDAGLQPRGGVVTGHAHRFVVAAAGMSGARLDGEWAVEIARRDYVLGGQIDVPHAAIWLPKIALGGRRPQRITQHDDVRFVDGASRAADARHRAESEAAPRPLTVDVKAKARTIYVRGKELDLELESTVSLKTPPAGGPLQLVGAVRIRRGRINVQGQRFDIGSGAFTFDGEPSNPRIDVSLSHSYPDARVVIELHGRPSKPELRLSSEPPIYDQAQIISLILTGEVQGKPGGGGSFDPTATIATAVVRQLADKIAPAVGLDVVRIERATPPDDAPTTGAGDFAGRVEVGKYINDRVYVSYAHRFGATERQNANEAHAEYRLSPHWLAETVFGDAGVGGVDAFWVYRY